MTIRLEHANLSVAEIDATTEFVLTAFPAFRVRGEGTGPGGRRWRHVGDDACYLALEEAREGSSGRRPYAPTTGLNHLGWEVVGLDALVERLAAAGYPANQRVDGHPYRRRAYVYDPDGNDWEFVEYLVDDPALRHAYD